MSEENKPDSLSDSQQTGNARNPLGNLHPAKIPTGRHTYSYDGGMEKKDKGNN